MQLEMPAMFPSPLLPILVDFLARLASLLRSEDGDEIIPDLLAAEEFAVALAQEFGRRVLETFLMVATEKALDGRPPCECGRPMEVLRRPSWTRKTLLGPVEVPDPYLYCRFCHVSDHPMQARLGTSPDRWSLPLQEAAVDLASDESCGKAVHKLARHHPGVEMGRTTALELLHHHGASAREFINHKLELAGRQAKAGLEPADAAVELEVEMDASMIPVATLVPKEVAPGEEARRTPVRGLPVRRKLARWEEVKAGLVQRPGALAVRLFTLRPTAGLNECFDDLPCLAAMLGRTHDTQVRGIADGATYIRKRMEDQFKDGPFRFILDRPHCKEHLSSAGALMEPFSGKPAQSWARDALDRLERGDATEVVTELRAAYEASGSDEASRLDDLRKAANYFDHNADAVEYVAYRLNGWSVASSEIESGHRHTVQTRMKISGAWWHPDGVDDILALRMLKANGWWDQYWAWKRKQWRSHAESMSSKRVSRAA